jgi:hypothetical protein
MPHLPPFGEAKIKSLVDLRRVRLPEVRVDVLETTCQIATNKHVLEKITFVTEKRCDGKSLCAN